MAASPADGLAREVTEWRELTLTSTAGSHGVLIGRGVKGPGVPDLHAGLGRDAFCVNDQHATAVQLYGEGDGSNEERLELRAIGGRDRARHGVPGRSRLFASRTG
jgi:hypothetical protein